MSHFTMIVFERASGRLPKVPSLEMQRTVNMSVLQPRIRLNESAEKPPESAEKRAKLADM